MTFAYSATTVVVPASQYNRTKVIPHKWQNRVVCGDGSVKTYDHDTIEWFIEVQFQCTYSQLIDVRNFFKNTVRYSALAFSFTPDAILDAGGGQGVAVTVNLWHDEIPEPYDLPSLFNVKLILRACSSGTGIPS